VGSDIDPATIGPSGLALREAKGPVGTLSLKLSLRLGLWSETEPVGNAAELTRPEIVSLRDTSVVVSGSGVFDEADTPDGAMTRVPIVPCPGAGSAVAVVGACCTWNWISRMNGRLQVNDCGLGVVATPVSRLVPVGLTVPEFVPIPVPVAVTEVLPIAIAVPEVLPVAVAVTGVFPVAVAVTELLPVAVAVTEGLPVAAKVELGVPGTVGVAGADSVFSVPTISAAVRGLLGVAVAVGMVTVGVFVPLGVGDRVAPGLLSVEICTKRYPPSGGGCKETVTA
jgi:hypothetical protein